MQYFFSFSFLLFGLGLGLVITKRSYLTILLGIELILNAGLLNFFTFSLYWKNTGDIQAILCLIIAIVVASASIALVMILQHYRVVATSDPQEKNSLMERDT